MWAQIVSRVLGDRPEVVAPPPVLRAVPRAPTPATIAARARAAEPGPIDPDAPAAIPLRYALEEAARPTASRRPPSPEDELRASGHPKSKQKTADVPATPPGADAITAAIHAGLDAADGAHLSTVDRAFIRHFRRTLQTSGPRLPPMPEAVVRIDRVLRKPDCAVTEVADVIRTDPVVATKIVGIANSPFYAGLGKIRGVEGAITRMGLRETKTIVQAIALGSRLMRVPGHEGEIERHYHHAIATAVAARVVASAAHEDADAAFLAGLIHDIGRTVFLAALGDFEHANGRRLTPSPETVEALSDALHEDLSALVAVAWRVGGDIEVAVRAHETPEQAPRGEGWRLTQVLALADDLARYVVDPQAAAGAIEETVRMRLAETLRIRDLEGLVGDVFETAQAFDVPVARRPDFDPLPEVVGVESLPPQPAANPPRTYRPG